MTAPSGGAAPIHYVLIHGSTGTDRVIPVSSSDSIMYTLCGLGQRCAIATGKPSAARGRLVRREILEMALYTFKYVSGIKSVVAFIPPANGKTFIVLLQKSDLSSELKTPLAQTISARTPLPAAIPAREVQLIDATTNSRVYTFGLQQTQQGDVVLILKPLPA